MNWRNWAMKLGYALGYKSGYDKSFAKGLEEGKKQGEMSALVLSQLLREYGGFDQIPTHLFKEMPMGEEFAQRQTLKRAFFALREMVEQRLDMPDLNELGNSLADFLENDPSMSDELTDRFETIMKSNSVFGALLSYAGDRGDVEIDVFMKNVHAEPAYRELYYLNLKNETYIVR
jgi:hypothetical protein